MEIDSKRITETSVSVLQVNQINNPSAVERRNQVKIYNKAIEEYRKLCLKTYSSPNPVFASILKSESLCIYLAQFNLKEIICINRIIGKYQYFKEIILAPFDPQKGDPNERKKKGFGIVTPLTPSEKEKAEKDEKEMRAAKQQKIYTIVQGVSRNLCLSEVVIKLTFFGLNLSTELTSFLSEGLIENKSLVAITVSNCHINVDSYEILLKGLLTHESIEFVDLSGNGFNDKYANMISRIIARQTQRRDLVIWSFGLRNERPLTNDYTRGLVFLNLSNNKFSDVGAEIITNALSYDQYIRSIDLSSNLFTKESCKKFIRMLRKNSTILSFDLKDNPGYDPEIHARMVMKMSKNIQYLNQQVIDNQYSTEEFNELKQFINLSFFNVDIPDEIIEMYNNQITSTQSQQQSTNDNNSNRNKKSKKIKQGKANYDEEQKHTEDVDDIHTKNKMLTTENIQLKKELFELRASKIYNSIAQRKNDKTNKCPPQIESKYNRIEQCLSELNYLLTNVESTIVQDDKSKQKPISKNIINPADNDIIGEESEEREQASSRKTKDEHKIASIQKDNLQQPKKSKDSSKKDIEQSSSKREIKVEDDYEDQEGHYKEEEPEEPEEYEDEMDPNVYEDQSGQQYMMYNGDNGEDYDEEEDDDIGIKKINKSF